MCKEMVKCHVIRINRPPPRPTLNSLQCLLLYDWLMLSGTAFKSYHTERLNCAAAAQGTFDDRLPLTVRKLEPSGLWYKLDKSCTVRHASGDHTIRFYEGSC